MTGLSRRRDGRNLFLTTTHPWPDAITGSILHRPLAPPQIAFPNEMICAEGDIGKHMFFIESGEIMVMSGDLRTTYATLGASAFVGEISILTGQKRTASIMTKTMTKLLLLSKADFDEVLLDFDEYAQTFQDIAKQRIEDKRQQDNLKKKEKLSDMVEKDIAESLVAPPAAPAEPRKLSMNSFQSLKASMAKTIQKPDKHRKLTQDEAFEVARSAATMWRATGSTTGRRSSSAATSALHAPGPGERRRGSMTLGPRLATVPSEDGRPPPATGAPRRASSFGATAFASAPNVGNNRSSVVAPSSAQSSSSDGAERSKSAGASRESRRSRSSRESRGSSDSSGGDSTADDDDDLSIKSSAAPLDVLSAASSELVGTVVDFGAAGVACDASDGDVDGADRAKTADIAGSASSADNDDRAVDDGSTGNDDRAGNNGNASNSNSFASSSAVDNGCVGNVGNGSDGNTFASSRNVSGDSTQHQRTSGGTMRMKMLKRSGSFRPPTQLDDPFATKHGPTAPKEKPTGGDPNSQRDSGTTVGHFSEGNILAKVDEMQHQIRHLQRDLEQSIQNQETQMEKMQRMIELNFGKLSALVQEERSAHSTQ